MSCRTFERGLFFIANKLLMYRDRTYYLDDKRIIVSRGKNKKSFLWSEFECFYPYRTYENQNNRLTKYAINASSQIQGQIFYLQKNK